MSPEGTFDAWRRNPHRGTLATLLAAAEERVFRICRRILRHPHDAEEATQEVLLEISTGLPKVRDEGHFHRWVGTVAFRTAVDRHRSRSRRRTRESLAAAGASARSDSPSLHDALSRLGEEDRALLVERYFERRTLREIADARGMSVGTARNRIDKARERLKRSLGTVFVGLGLMKSKMLVAAAALLLIALAAGISLSRRKPTQEPTPVPEAVAAAETPPLEPPFTAPSLAAVPEKSPEAGALSWTQVPAFIAGVPCPWIPVPGKNRMPFINHIMISRDHSLSWGANEKESQRLQVLWRGVEKLDGAIFKAWGGTVKPAGPHDSGTLEEPDSLASFLLDVAEGRRLDVLEAARTIEAPYAFQQAASAVRMRALAMMGSLPRCEPTLSYQRGVLAGKEPPQARALAAAGLVRTGHEGDALSIFQDATALPAFLSMLSLGTWDGVHGVDPRHATDDYPIAGPDCRNPVFLAEVAAVVRSRPDRAAFLEGAKVLALTPDEPVARAVLAPLWEEARTDPGLAEKLMENKYQWRDFPGIGPILRDLARGSDRRVSLLATSQLWVMTDEASVATLVELLRHEDVVRVRVAAAALSGGGGVLPEVTIPALQALVKSTTDEQVRERARQSLKQIRQFLASGRR